MEIFETTISKLIKYILYLDTTIKSSVEDSLEREDIFKLLNYSKRLLTVIQTPSEGVNILCTDIYIFLRKISEEITNHNNSNLFSKDKTFKNLKESCKRNHILLEDKYSEILNHPKNKSFEKIKISIDVSYFINIPKSPEFNFTHLVRNENDIFYFETDDSFQYLYFFLGLDLEWYWSPPKKEDLQDIWIKVPSTKIVKGHYSSQTVQKYTEDFIIWLDVFSPNLPEKV